MTTEYSCSPHTDFLSSFICTPILPHGHPPSLNSTCYHSLSDFIPSYSIFSTLISLLSSLFVLFSLLSSLSLIFSFFSYSLLFSYFFLTHRLLYRVTQLESDLGITNNHVAKTLTDLKNNLSKW